MPHIGVCFIKFVFAAAYVEMILELTNINQPQTMPVHHMKRYADSLVNIISANTTNLRFMTLIIKQMYVFLNIFMSRKFKGKEEGEREYNREVAHSRAIKHTLYQVKCNVYLVEIFPLQCLKPI